MSVDLKYNTDKNIKKVMKDVDSSLNNIKQITQEVMDFSGPSIIKKIDMVEKSLRTQTRRFQILMFISFFLIFGVGMNVLLNYSRIQKANEINNKVLSILEENRNKLIGTELEHSALVEEIRELFKERIRLSIEQYNNLYKQVEELNSNIVILIKNKKEK